MRRSRAGYTLVEMMIVVAMVAVLSGVAFAVGKMVMGRSDQAACLSNLRQIGAGIESYLQDQGPILPDWRAGRKVRGEEVKVMEDDLKGYVGDGEVFHCPADDREYARSGSSYLWNSTQSGRHRMQLQFFGQDSDGLKRIPLVTDKESWHPGESGVNFLYADMSASSNVTFGAGPKP